MIKHLFGIVALSGGALAGATTAMGQEEALAVPSGLALRLQEVRLEEGLMGQLAFARFRFVAPAIAQDAGFAEVENDFAHLCTSVALPMLADRGQTARRVVISYADKELEFGATDPHTVQFFEVFRVENDTCIWEGF